MIRYSPLFDSQEFRIGRFDHPAEHRHQDPPEEVSPDYSVNRIERGSFMVQLGRRHWDLRPGDLFLNSPGMEFRCRHRELVPNDVCTTIACAPPGDPSDEMVSFDSVVRKQPVLPPSNRLAYLFLQVRRADEPMAREEAAHYVIAEIAGQSSRLHRLYPDRQLSWYADRVDAARQQMDRHYASEHRLAWLARSVAMSPFHFARIFHELVGIAPHSYLRRIRLQRAARSLREGASVTEACFSSGFQNLSHFSRQFYRQFGVRASTYARQPSR